MKQFVDANGRAWAITINVGTALDVQANLGINLFDPNSVDEKTGVALSVRLLCDDLFLAEIVSLLVSEQVDAQGLKPREFLAGLDGNALKNMETAFFEEYVDFFIQRGREILANAIQSQREKFLSTLNEFGNSLDEQD